MPKNMGIVRPDRVLVVGTVEDYITVEHKVSEKQLAARGHHPTSWLTYEEDCGSPTRGAQVATEWLVSLPYSPPFLTSDGGMSPATSGLIRSDGLQVACPHVYQERHSERT
jgi:hypothetical protein